MSMMYSRLDPPLVILSLVDVGRPFAIDEPPVVSVFWPLVLPQPLLGTAVPPAAPPLAVPPPRAPPFAAPPFALAPPAALLPVAAPPFPVPPVTLAPPAALLPVAVVAPPFAVPLRVLPPFAAPPVSAPPLARSPVDAPPLDAPPVAWLLEDFPLVLPPEDVPPASLLLVLPPVAAPPVGEELPPPTFDIPELVLPSPFSEQPTLIVRSVAATIQLPVKSLRIGLSLIVGRSFHLVQKSSRPLRIFDRAQSGCRPR